ncbi:MAG: hypothetical protein P1Q69_12435, partial [Candidatus Thorarchaeota archaeon]|nr:hypothetical protein [Candidatus Thorarchaeota archaeon]
ADVIDLPLGEDLIVEGNWYSFDVTDEVLATYNDDRTLSLVLKQVSETGTDETWKYFAEKDYAATNSTFLLIEYAALESTALTVDGISSTPLIEYIQTPTPLLEWDTLGSATGASQRDYEVEVWNNEYFNDTLFFEDTRGEIYTVYDSDTGSNSRPFGTDDEMRYQMKFETGLFSQGGLIDKLLFKVAETTGTAIFENLEINMINEDINDELTVNFDANYGDEFVTNVLKRDSYEAKVVDQWLIFDIEDSFVCSGADALIIEFRFTNNTGDLLAARLSQSTSEPGSVAYSYGVNEYYGQTAGLVYNRTHCLKLEFASVPVLEFSDSPTNNFPFSTDIGKDGRFQQMYNKSLIGETGLIDTLYFSSNGKSDSVFENLIVRLVETPHECNLNHLNMDANFGGNTPTVVIDTATYTAENIGRIGLVRFSTPFEYTGENNLLIDMQWSSRVSGGFTVARGVGEGGYRAFNVTYLSLNINGNDTAGTDLHLGFVNAQTESLYAGTALTNATQYFWRVRVCDGTGIWGEWATQSFNYTELSSVPEWTSLVFDPDPGIATKEVDVSLDVTYFLGITQVILEIDGANHTMAASGDTYSYTWTPATAGNYTYTIYMESTIGTWSNTTGIFEVDEAYLIPGLPIDTTTLLLIVIGVLVLIIIVVACRKRK